MPKADIHYLYNQKVTNKKLIIVFLQLISTYISYFERVIYIYIEEKK